MSDSRGQRRAVALVAAIAAVAAIAMNGCGGGSDGNGTPDAGPPPVGALVVAWSVVKGDGLPTTCGDVGADNAVVSIGAEPMTVPCTQGHVRFDSLLPGRFPVRVSIQTGGVEIGAASGNADVKAGPDTVFTASVTIERAGTDTGSLHLTWGVAGTDAAGGCPLLGGVTVHIQTREGSIADFQHDAPCNDGQVTIDTLRPGVYALLMKLLDAGGNQVAVTGIEGIRVDPGMTAEADRVEFSNSLPTRARLVGLWTVNSTTATVGCGLAGAQAVRLSAAPAQMTLLSTTTDCRLGRAVIDALPPGMYDVRFDLKNALGIGSLTSTSIYGVRLQPMSTTTVSVDLIVRTST